MLSSCADGWGDTFELDMVSALDCDASPAPWEGESEISSSMLSELTACCPDVMRCWLLRTTGWGVPSASNAQAVRQAGNTEKSKGEVGLFSQVFTVHFCNVSELTALRLFSRPFVTIVPRQMLLNAESYNCGKEHHGKQQRFSPHVCDQKKWMAKCWLINNGQAVHVEFAHWEEDSAPLYRKVRGTFNEARRTFILGSHVSFHAIFWILKKGHAGWAKGPKF